MDPAQTVGFTQFLSQTDSVGKAILGRMFDVFGNAIDGAAAPAAVEWRTVHRVPPPLAQRSTRSEIFETGIKVIDVLVPIVSA